jgi:hypothetical protein
MNIFSGNHTKELANNQQNITEWQTEETDYLFLATDAVIVHLIAFSGDHKTFLRCIQMSQPE